jgi:hypothetical protein
MMEGGGWSFGGERQRTPETPEHILRELARNELWEIRRSSENPLSIAIAEKALQKMDIKDLVDDMDNHQDDIHVRQKMKRLGSLIIVENIAIFDIDDEASGLHIKKDEAYLDLHVPPLEGEEKSLGTINHSFDLLAQYIRYHKLDHKYLIGVTYEKLAKVSRRYGFTVLEIKIPQEISAGVQRVYDRFRSEQNKELNMGKILMVFQETEKFLSKHAQKES